MEAIYRALVEANTLGKDKVTIYSDSKYAIDSLTKWSLKWIKNNWKTSNGKHVIHEYQFKKILKLSDKIKVEYVHVRGHKGNQGNEIADELATKGAKKSI